MTELLTFATVLAAIMALGLGARHLWCLRAAATRRDDRRRRNEADEAAWLGMVREREDRERAP